jgi:hypothetical protein
MTRSGHGLLPHEEERVSEDFDVLMATVGGLPFVDRMDSTVVVVENG